ncbi:putative cytochrome P450 [Zopfia rhizophila CBS 207.26]|uniref:Putative cytochrome P450 n=1 Tax=Zopfia rhizophila CBS 207.26 TaxID=1314779 RepID=A0A6A6E2U1_9PEZI|nr:putative cytochrome P450 [Zopfia rhizophila CBS 207.26]
MDLVMLKMLVESFLTIYWVYPLILFAYYGFEVIATRKVARKNTDYPLIGTWAPFTPRVIHNLIFAGKAVKILEEGYRKFKNKAFRLIRNEGSIVILPNCLLEELSLLPSNIASPHGALEHDLLGHYTGLNLILESRLHHSIVQRKLTPRLGLVTPGLENELQSAFEDYFPECDDWIEFQPYQVFGKVSARLSARALVGPGLCRHPTWLDISVNYTENLFRTIVILRLFPAWMHPLICYSLPSYWYCNQYVRKAKSLLSPIFRDLIRKSDDGLWSPQGTAEDSNVLCWLADTAKGRDRDADTLAHVEVLLALASVHTTLLRMVNVLYDTTANPEYFDELQAEIQGLNDSQNVWDTTSYSKLEKLDSVLRESQRMSPPTTLGLKRLFKEPYTFSNGMHIPKGTYVCLPTFAIENDPDNTTNPEVFDGLRSYRLRQRKKHGNMQQHSTRNDDHLFSSMEPTVLNFGYGKTACPGRHFASLVIKILFVKLLSEYDFKFLPGMGRPKNLMAHEFLFCWPWQKMLVRRKKDGICPF